MFFFLFILRLNVETGDERASYLTRLGINQIRGVMSHVHSAIHSYRKGAQKNLQMYPIKVIAEPTVHAAESAFHIRDLLVNANYDVDEQSTDLGLQFNYFEQSMSRFSLSFEIFLFQDRPMIFFNINAYKFFTFFVIISLPIRTMQHIQHYVSTFFVEMVVCSLHFVRKWH